jgi:hypothetical protein
VRYTSEVAGRLREEVRNRRRRIIQAVTSIQEDLPREAASFLDAQPPAGYPGTCFLWPKVFLDGETFWRLNCVVSKTGWPALLWVVDVFVTELAE